jgi:hypothetical protein
MKKEEGKGGETILSDVSDEEGKLKWERARS